MKMRTTPEVSSVPPEETGAILEVTPAGHPSENFLKLYASNDIGPRRRKRVADHLEQCQECRIQLAQIREARRRLRELLRLALAVG